MDFLLLPPSSWEKQISLLLSSSLFSIPWHGRETLSNETWGEERRKSVSLSLSPLSLCRHSVGRTLPAASNILPPLLSLSRQYPFLQLTTQVEVSPLPLWLLPTRDSGKGVSPPFSKFGFPNETSHHPEFLPGFRRKLPPPLLRLHCHTPRFLSLPFSSAQERLKKRILPVVLSNRKVSFKLF